jgi:hypothetical protein
MDGIAVIRNLMVAHADLTALVPADRVVAGTLPTGVALPAIAITRVSMVDDNIVTPGASRHVNERVQVTVLAKNYPTLRNIMRKVKKAGADKLGNLAGLTNVTVRTDGAGPDFMDEQASIHMGEQDFLVGYTELT